MVHQASSVIEARQRESRPLAPVPAGITRLRHTRSTSATKRQRRKRPRDPDLSKLQCIKDDKIIGIGDDRHIQLHCYFKDNTNAWLRESTVQEASNAAVCTYWGCGPGEEWKRPGGGSALESIPPVPLKVVAYRKLDTEARLQMVGSPASQEQWMSVEDVKAQWPAFYERCCLKPQVSSAQTTAKRMMPESGERGDLQTIVGHRLKEDDKDGDSKFQLSCQWASGPETWEYEEDIQASYNAAVLTYWNSEPELRKRQATEGKVSDRYLQILSHRKLRRTLEVQWVGYSACPDDTSWEHFDEVERNWPSRFKSYVAEHSLK